MSTPAPSPAPGRLDFAGLAADLYRDGIVGLPGASRRTGPTCCARTSRRRSPRPAATRRARSAAVRSATTSRSIPSASAGSSTWSATRRSPALCAEVLGPDYLIIELGFDVPLAGAQDQPWHRDFRTPPETGQHRPADLAGLQHHHGRRHPGPGAVRDRPGHPVRRRRGVRARHVPAGRRPTPATRRWASRRYPERGDVAARTGLTIHRGTQNHSDRSPGGADPRRGDRRHRPERDRGPRPGASPASTTTPCRRRSDRTCTARWSTSSTRSCRSTTSRA